MIEPFLQSAIQRFTFSMTNGDAVVPFQERCALFLDYRVGVSGSGVLDSWRCPVTGRTGTASGGARPTIDADGISFDGIDDSVGWPWVADFAAGSGLDIFVAMTSSSASATRAVCSVYGTPVASQSWILLGNGVGVTTAGSMVVDELTTGTDRIAPTAADITSGVKVLAHGQFTGTQLLAYVDGVAGAPTACAGASVPDGSTSFRLATHATAGNFLQMKVHGLLLYKSAGGLSTAERQAVEAFCRVRFGTP
jgi:hypothetical protein